MDTTAQNPSAALVIGEALIDVVDRGDERLEFVGGGPLNIAVGLSRLDHRTRLLTHIARDERGERIAAHLHRDGVDLDSGSWSATRTPTALARIGADGAAEYRFDITWEVAEQTGVSAGLVHVGSIGLFLEPGGSRVLELVERLPDETVVTLDPNIRPALMPEHAAALARFEAAAARADLVKLSDEDAAWLYPGQPTGEVAARILALDPARARPALVCVTRGADGAEGYTRESGFWIPARPAAVVDTISAGDSFMASLASSLLELGARGAAEELPGVLDRAARAAAFAVSSAGANPPTRAELAAGHSDDVVLVGLLDGDHQPIEDPRPSEITRVRLMNEYGVDFPLWAHTDDDGPYFLEALVSDELGDRLRAWAATFNASFSDESGWPDLGLARAHYRKGRELFAALVAELGRGVEASFDYWETCVAGESLELAELSGED